MTFISPVGSRLGSPAQLTGLGLSPPTSLPREDLRVEIQEGKSPGVCALIKPLLVLFADVLLAKADHMAQVRTQGGEERTKVWVLRAWQTGAVAVNTH